VTSIVEFARQLQDAGRGRVEAATEASPYDVCPAVIPNFQRLVGLRIYPGFHKQVRDLLGGTQGCTHLVDLLGPVATTAYQTVFPYRAREYEERLAREFWGRAERFAGCMVTFNGRRFDFPVLELAALRYGIAAPAHFADGSGSSRARYSTERHLDLADYLTNFGATAAVKGGMDLLLKMIGLPGKTEVDGSQVESLYEQGRMEEIHRYCRSDVVQTYFLFLRVELMRGRIDDAGYRSTREASAHFLPEIGAPPSGEPPREQG
jgi:predicted PolB exonuclease-like 3'-5' exonuclease